MIFDSRRQKNVSLWIVPAQIGGDERLIKWRTTRVAVFTAMK